MLSWCSEQTPPGSSVLELAAGTGAATKVLAPIAGRYVATDGSEEMLRHLRRKLTGLSLETRRHDMLIPWPDEEKFEVVVAANVLHLLEHPERALRWIRRVVAPGGLLLAPTFCHGQSRLSRWVSKWAGVLGFPVRQRLTAEVLTSLLRESDFQVRECRVVTSWVPLVLISAQVPRRPPWTSGRKSSGTD